MKTFLEFLGLMILTVIFYQFYAFTITRKAQEKQDKCQKLGILYFTIGTACLALRDAAGVIAGFLLIMLGLRLIAHGLDRIDKKIFIDHYDDDDTKH